jgi:chaperone LolA
MTRRILILLLALGVAAPALADALQSLHAFTEATRTLSGRFNQVVFDRNNRKTQEASGEMYFSRPGKFRWVYQKPYEQLIVGDGKSVWFYDADLAQVTKRRMDQAIGESPAALLAGSNEIDKYFNLKDAGQGEDLNWLEATPKSKSGSFEVVRLGFAGNLLKMMELKDNFGQTTLLRFDDLKLNPKLAPSLFGFAPPKGVDVLSAP